MDNKLYELCKEVYELTGWEGEGVWGTLPQDFGKDAQARLYTSDYLLEKLPATVQSKGETYFLMIEPFEDKTWHAVYGFSDRDGWYTHEDYKSSVTDTPLKALLRLTIALHEAGELKESKYD